VLSFLWKSQIEDIEKEIERLKSTEHKNYEKIVNDIKEMGDNIGTSVESLVTGFAESSKTSQQMKSHILRNSRSLELLSDRVKRLEIKDDKALKESILNQETDDESDKKIVIEEKSLDLKKYGIVAYCTIAPFVAAAAVYLVMTH
tara:strand:+ start:68 stop:502 length:435 start_codon:yes stop_codon:yes gene_type:complete